MRVYYSAYAAKFLDKQPKDIAMFIRAAIHKLTYNPPQGDVSLLRNFTDNRKRLRLDKWRVIFKQDEETDNDVEVMSIINYIKPEEKSENKDDGDVTAE